jgi:hypothetical protein
VFDGSGILGAHGGTGHGVTGHGGFGVTGIGTVMGVWGIAKGRAWAGYFSGAIRVEGDSQFAADISVEGNITVRGDVLLPDRDIAERFEVEDELHCPPGTVMVIGENGRLLPCLHRYDKRAVGIVAGAGTLRSAITLGANGDVGQKAAIALVGTAFCLIDADIEPIEVGDLITTSDTPGHGMLAKDVKCSRGAIIGKSLAALTKGKGLLPLLLTLQ